MKRANNIIELFQNLSPAIFLKAEDTEFYVPLYEEEIGEIKVELLHDLENYKTIYVSGQPGSGKTTALNFLPDKSVEEKFVIKRFYVKEVLGDSDIDIVDILLMLCYELIRDNEDLKLEMGERIKTIGEQLRDELEISEETTKENAASVEGKIGLSLPSFFRLFGGDANVEANYKYNHETRNAVRRVLKPKLEDLLALVNEIIVKYLADHAADNQQLLLFMHDLNHMQGAQTIKDLFVKNRLYLERINAAKIITIPVGLRALQDFPPEIFFLGLKTKANPHIESSDTNLQVIKANKQQLKNIIEKRIHPEQQLIERKAIELAIDNSGGIVRQLIDILHHATRKVINNGDIVFEHHVREGMKDIRHKISRSIIAKDHILMLDFIRQKYSSNTQNENMLIESAAANQIIVYKNNDIWYDINPLIENTVKTYAANLTENGE